VAPALAHGGGVDGGDLAGAVVEEIAVIAPVPAGGYAGRTAADEGRDARSQASPPRAGGRRAADLDALLLPFHLTLALRQYVTRTAFE